MPLKSGELHRLARQMLGPVLESLGFKRTRKTSLASWVRPESDRWIVIWVQPSQFNDAYSPGFKFTVELRLTEKPAVYASGPHSRLPSLMTDQEREELRQLENRVTGKLPLPDQEFAKSLPAGVRDHWLAGWELRVAPYGPDEDIWFRHGDEQDARALMSFFQRALPGAVSRFVERTSATG